MDIELSFEPKAGDMLPADGVLLLVVEIRPTGMLLAEVRCDWTAWCVNSASMLLPHPIGPVAACDRCGDPINATYRTMSNV